MNPRGIRYWVVEDVATEEWLIAECPGDVIDVGRFNTWAGGRPDAWVAKSRSAYPTYEAALAEAERLYLVIKLRPAPWVVADAARRLLGEME